LPGHKPQDKKPKESRTASSKLREITPEEYKNATGQILVGGFGFHAQEVRPRHRMKKTVTIAAVIGVNVGIFWVSVVGAVLNLYEPLRPLWTATMWVSCPPILAIRTAWWLVPVLNGILYVGIAASIQFLRRFIIPFANRG
jgi:hypothetical protein